MGRIFLGTFLGLLTIGFVFLVVLILSFRMGGEARAVSQAVIAATPGEWSPEIELGVGRLPALLARTGIRLAQVPLDLPPEALAAAASFRSADVGVYRRSLNSMNSSPSKSLENVEAAMLARDWEPIVSVREKHECVQIFVPKSMNSHRDTQACVFVMDRNELVIVSARVDLEPLVAFASQHLANHPFGHWK